MLHLKQQKNPKILGYRDLFEGKNCNIQKLSNELIEYSTIEHGLFKEWIREGKKIVSNQPNIIDLNDPVTIIGDIHGQLYDLLKILSLIDLIKSRPKVEQKIIFLGDYVDRGYQSMQVITLLLVLKLQYPENVFLIRGNHESRAMTEQYNFRSECIEIYNQEIYDLMMEFFDSLPLACIVNKAYFCVHGGISDKQATIGKINSIQRMCEIPLANVLYCDLIWSDPVDDESGKLRTRSTFNFDRDCSILFGATLVNEFLAENNLKCVIRAHQVFLQGYKLHKWNKSSTIPPVITIFSAPNYCGTYNNKGAIMKINNNQMRIKQIKEHEPEKNKCLTFDVFCWTMDEIMTNVHELMCYMTKSFVNKRCPELKGQSLYDQGLMFVKYALQAHKVKPSFRITETSIMRSKMTEQQEKNFMFNRSNEFYREIEKVHKKK